MHTASAGPSANSAQKLTTCESDRFEWLRPSGSSIFADGRDHAGRAEHHYGGDERARRGGQRGEAWRVEFQRAHSTRASRRGACGGTSGVPAACRSAVDRAASMIRKNASAIAGSYIVPLRSRIIAVARSCDSDRR
jgi:hypothetical protein